jgi:hypothetical protein
LIDGRPLENGAGWTPAIGERREGGSPVTVPTPISAAPISDDTHAGDPHRSTLKNRLSPVFVPVRPDDVPQRFRTRATKNKSHDVAISAA